MDTNPPQLIKDIVKASQGIDRQGLSQISKHDEPYQCVDCTEIFQRTITIWPGHLITPNIRCPKCSEKEKKAKEHVALEAELQKVIERQRDIWYDASMLIMGGKTFDNFDKHLQLRAFNAVKNLPEGRSLVLMSPNLYGVGKTHLVCALATQIIETKEPAVVRPDGAGNLHIIPRRHPPVVMFQENTLLRRIRNTYNQGANETEDAVFNDICAPPLIIIDDIGKVKPRDLSFLQGVWFNIIDNRYTNELPIVLTTNLTPTELEAHIGGASADRLREMCGKSGFITMTGTSYRRK